ncbi:MAG: hypothetical protein C0424_07275 [Sphingobacteriaceae bacterium]|nr:hypothetical protein [Sphingobacteriaceae bacterium]
MKTTFTTVLFCLLLSQAWAQKLDSTSTYWWSGNVYDRSNTTRYEYDATGRLSGYRSFARDGLLNWREVTRSEYFYNSQGLPHRLVTMNVDAQGNLDSGATLYWQYTANSQIAVETRVFWAGNNRIVTQTTNQYAANGLLDSTWIENNGGSGNTLSLESTTKFHYAAGKLVRYDTYLNGAGGLRRGSRVQLAYDGLNRLQDELSFSWNTQSNSFDLQTEVEYFYTASRALPDSLKGIESQAFPGSPTVYKRQFSYNVNDSLVLSETFDGTTGNWVPLWKQTFAYFGLGTGIVQAKSLDFKVFPNPATDQLYIRLTEPQLATVSIQSLSGQTIKQLALPLGQSSIDLLDLPKGMYLLHLQAGGKLAVHKFVKH